jgi:hypothetical protein
VIGQPLSPFHLVHGRAGAPKQLFWSVVFSKFSYVQPLDQYSELCQLCLHAQPCIHEGLGCSAQCLLACWWCYYFTCMIKHADVIKRKVCTHHGCQTGCRVYYQ